MEVSKPACEACKYSNDAGYSRYECRAKSPTYDYKNPHRRFFPLVAPDDWCAKYKLNEEFEIKPEPKPHEESQRIIDEWVQDYDAN